MYYKNYYKLFMLALFFWVVVMYLYYVDNLNSSIFAISTRMHRSNNETYINATVIAQLKRHCYSIMKQNAAQGYVESEKSRIAMPLMEHYKITPFQLSPNHTFGFSFDYINAWDQNDIRVWNQDEDTQCQGKERFICQIHSNQVNIGHFPHFAQEAYPCFSALQQAKLSIANSSIGSLEPFILQLVIHERSQNRIFEQTYIKGLIQSFQNAGFQLEVVYEYVKHSAMTECDWIAKKTNIQENVSGWPTKNKNGWSINNAKYFSTHRDVQLLQQATLGEKYEYGPSNTLPIRVLIIDRARTTRHWIYSHQTKSVLESAWNNYTKSDSYYNNARKIVDIRIISNPKGSFKKQAYQFHTADIILSSHGAALTTLAFIRPCTAVIELFPFSYYLGFFQPLVLAAGGLSFDGYPFHGSYLKDTVETNLSHVQARGVDLLVSPESIVYAFPGIVMKMITCRENY